ncbi:hypothetical protein [Haloechinothrix alba]|uniref:hypothetical protein n=1 Tax=Haloechinothrix alba TaxID=664784 RepID=UPI0015951254|nr:hypothetical protein [Haloechinothrix alba]
MASSAMYISFTKLAAVSRADLRPDVQGVVPGDVAEADVDFVVGFFVDVRYEFWAQDGY